MLEILLSNIEATTSTDNFLIKLYTTVRKKALLYLQVYSTTSDCKNMHNA